MTDNSNKPKKILNDAANAVEEFIEGLLLQYPTRLVKLENHHVVLAANRNNSGHNVQLISGGGSGHEPSHAGWLDGCGMLSAAVCGGIFASPPVSCILAAIRAVAATAASDQQAAKGGVLLIVKNYTGDRLNFGMAAEKAQQELGGIRVEMVVVADDVALPRTKGITGARGVAGTILVHKVAGAAAAAGQSLDDVVAVARRVCRRMGTLGIALDAVTVPGAGQKNDRLDASTIEIGLGIHGEAGMRQSPLLTANEMAREMITTIQTHGRQEDDGSIVPLFQANDQVVVLVNNLGGTSNFEMSILARSCVKLLESDEFGATATRVLVGSFMTSFDMHRASLTIVNVQDQPDILALLDAPTTAPAWSGVDIWHTASGEQRPSMIQVPEIVVNDKSVVLRKPELKIPGFDAMAKSMVKSAAEKLADAEALLTKYDTVVGDGDCGITMKRGAVEVLKRLENGTIPVDHPVSMFAALADAVSASMGGTSGVLLELMFRKMSSTLSFCGSSKDDDTTIGVSEMCLAVQAGVDAVSLYGGAQVGSRTMLDALVPAASSLVATKSMVEAAAKAKAGAESTAAMKTASDSFSYMTKDTHKTPKSNHGLGIYVEEMQRTRRTGTQAV